jgi:hypothetical protein
MFAGVVASQLPGRHPKDFPVPDWYHTWMLDYAAGADMAHYYGAKPPGSESRSGDQLRTGDQSQETIR